jgi:hypothetical protein
MKIRNPKEGDILEFNNGRIDDDRWGVVILGKPAPDGSGFASYSYKHPVFEGWRESDDDDEPWDPNADNNGQKIRRCANPDEALVDYVAWKLIHG